MKPAPPVTNTLTASSLRLLDRLDETRRRFRAGNGATVRGTTYRSPHAAEAPEARRSQAYAVIRLDLDEPVAVPHVVHSTVGADHATGFQDTGGEGSIEPSAVKDSDLFARILELCDATARRADETR